MAQTSYCTTAEVEGLFSQEGVTNFADDDADAVRESGVVDACITWASAKIDFYCGRRYAPAQLALSHWVTGHAVTLATFRLMHRRGHGPSESMQAAYEAAIEELKMVMEGAVIPGALLRASRAPAMSNYRVVGGYRNADIRVTERNSVYPSSPPDRDVDPSGGVE